MQSYINKKLIIFLTFILFFITIFTTSQASSNSDNLKSEEKVIYLTFDDGPDKYVTDGILDVLNTYNIKGTFFVMGGQFKGNEDVLKRIHLEGHSLGLHSYTHNFSKLYSNNNTVVNIDFFMNEMLKCQKELKDITGVSSTILRFPGGSHKRLSESVRLEFNKHDFKVYDWTHDSGDGANVKAPPEYLFKKSLKKIPSCKKAPGVILLMHCNASNKNSVTALPKIIEHYKSEGYKFLPITNSTPEYHCE